MKHRSILFYYMGNSVYIHIRFRLVSVLIADQSPSLPVSPFRKLISHTEYVLKPTILQLRRTSWAHDVIVIVLTWSFLSHLKIIPNYFKFVKKSKRFGQRNSYLRLATVTETCQKHKNHCNKKTWNENKISQRHSIRIYFKWNL